MFTYSHLNTRRGWESSRQLSIPLNGRSLISVRESDIFSSTV